VRKWAFFVSHASEDKEAIAEPLVAALRKAGVAVWYDRTELKVGDSLRRKIDEGLALSRYGIVILSPEFFAKKWPQAELDGLAARQTMGKKVILPVLHRITIEELQAHSPMLAGVYCLEWERGVERVIAALLDVLDEGESVSGEFTKQAIDQRTQAEEEQPNRTSISGPDHVGQPAGGSADLRESPDMQGQASPPVDISPQNLFLAARDLVAQGGIASLEVRIEDLAAECLQAMRDGQDELALRALDHLTATIAATVAYRDANRTVIAARQLPDLYNAMLRNLPRLRVDVTLMAKQLLLCIDVLGALAVRRRNWPQVRALAVQTVTGESNPEVRYVLRHAQLHWARSRRDSRESLLHLAHSMIQDRPWLRIDALADDPLVLQSLCQFDLLAGLMLLVAPADESDAAAVFWPEFARFPTAYSDPVLDDVLEDQTARIDLGIASDGDLVAALNAVDRLARSESFAPYMGWSGYRARSVATLRAQEGLK
jgi:hypothetical protein